VRIHWNLVYKAFHRIGLCGNEQIVSSNSNVILTRQTCGQHSSRVAGRKHRKLEFYFSVRIWYVFSMSKFRGESDLGLCMSWVRAKRMRLRSADFRFKNVFGRRIRWKSALRSRILFARTKLMHGPRSNSSLYFDIKNTYHIRTEK